MGKDYFSHDYHARDELRSVRKNYGLEGYGFFWALVEILHECGGSIPESELESIVYDLHTTKDLAEYVVKESGFFKIKKGKITSDRVSRNIKKRAEISAVRKQAADSRWQNEAEGTNTHSAEAEDPDQIMNKPLVKTATDAPVGFVGEGDAISFQESVSKYREMFDELFEKWEAETDILEDDKVYSIRPLFDNLFEEIRTQKYLVINRRRVSTLDFLHAMQYFFRSERGRSDMNQAICDVDELVRSGRVRNRQNYLISALFNSAKMNGG